MKTRLVVWMVKILKTTPRFSLVERDALSEAFEIAEKTLDIEYELDETVRSKVRALIIHVARGRLRLGIDITDAFAIQAIAADTVDLLYMVRRLAV